MVTKRKPRKRRKAAYQPKATIFGKRPIPPAPRPRKKKRLFFQREELNHLILENDVLDVEEKLEGFNIVGNPKNKMGMRFFKQRPDAMTDEELLARAKAEAEAWQNDLKKKVKNGNA